MRRFVLLLIAAILSVSAAAHEADSSYLRLRFKPGKLETKITFDAFTLLKIVPDLDTNHDNAISKEELENAVPQIQQFIEANYTVELDGKPIGIGIDGEPVWPLDAPDPLPRERWHDQTALFLFPFEKELPAKPSSARVKVDAFLSFGKSHRVMAVVENDGESRPAILNAELPTWDIALAPAAAAPDTQSQPSSASQFFHEGVQHILTGYDHICFLLALLVAAARFRQLLGIITAFTVAHSITLILAAQEIVKVNPRLIESAIAATILYVALENIWRKEPKFRWGLTFAFGLIHGFGFANALRELTLPKDAMVSSLLLFNVGVEVGQLAIVAVAWPLLQLATRPAWGRIMKPAMNCIAGLLGLAWLIDRAFNLEWMRF